MNKKPLLFAVAILSIFAILIGFFISGLGKDPHDLPSVMTGRPLPKMTLPSLDGQQQLTNADLPIGKPFLINIWGTWCPACLQEHAYLLQLGKRIPIVGVNWAADNPNEPRDAQKLLVKAGNPFHLIMADRDGRLVTDLGVYGAPETFLIGTDGKILLRYAGILDPTIWQEQFEPLLEEGKK